MKLGLWGGIGKPLSIGLNGNISNIQYILRDDFNDTVAAGAVNGTPATPTGGARTVTDTNSKLSLGGGSANFATGGVGAGNPGIWYPSFTSVVGRCIVGHMNMVAGSGGVLGFDANTASFPNDGIRFQSTTTINSIFNGGAASTAVGTITTGVDYYVAVVQRGAGAFIFIKGGTYTNWTLLAIHNLGAIGTRSPSLVANAATSVFSSAFVRVPQNIVSIVPIASDAFTRVDGGLGNTGGGGSEELGGNGLPWVSQKGTWGISSNKASSSVLDGVANISVATVPCNTTNILAEVVATRSAGTSGLCLRYVDANNYIKIVHNGTNVQVIEVVNGTPNTLTNAAVAYSASSRFIVSLNGAKLRSYYGDVFVAEVTTAITTGSDHGIFTDDIGATFDNFVVWAKGNGGEYESIFSPYANP